MISLKAFIFWLLSMFPGAAGGVDTKAETQALEHTPMMFAPMMSDDKPISNGF